MTAGRSTRRGFLLLELVIVVVLAAGVLWILSKLLIDGLYLQRIAGQHVARVGVVDALTRRIRTDALSAIGYGWRVAEREATLVLSGRAGGSTSEVRYVFEPDRVVRSERSGESVTWQRERLRFAARTERGPQADILYVDFIELPPPRATVLPDRRFSVSVLLPRAADDSRLGSERGP